MKKAYMFILVIFMKLFTACQVYQTPDAMLAVDNLIKAYKSYDSDNVQEAYNEHTAALSWCKSIYDAPYDCIHNLVSCNAHYIDRKGVDNTSFECADQLDNCIACNSDLGSSAYQYCNDIAQYANSYSGLPGYTNVSVCDLSMKCCCCDASNSCSIISGVRTYNECLNNCLDLTGNDIYRLTTTLSD